MIYTLVLASSLLQQPRALYADAGEHKVGPQKYHSQARATATEPVRVTPGPPVRLRALPGSSTRRWGCRSWFHCLAWAGQMQEEPSASGCWKRRLAALGLGNGRG